MLSMQTSSGKGPNRPRSRMNPLHILDLSGLCHFGSMSLKDEYRQVNIPSNFLTVSNWQLARLLHKLDRGAMAAGFLSCTSQ